MRLEASCFVSCILYRNKSHLKFS
uniref:Uncharacterized protein n=1 Tax=Anguilla anguilla TaxID=7936 RepID=A0A0E9PJU2_ANGAN